MNNLSLLGKDIAFVLKNGRNHVSVFFFLFTLPLGDTHWTVSFSTHLKKKNTPANTLILFSYETMYDF